MYNSQNNEIKLCTKTVLEIFENNFFIPSYQRGYRWTEKEVERLLNDIYANKGKNYCLQPVVVKKLAENKFELIDGQQRITTLFILLQYIKSEFKIPIKFETKLEYQTRPDSADYLTDDNKNSKKSSENIDFFHMYKALEKIRTWFDDKDKLKKQSQNLIAAFEIFVALNKTVKVIWYETGNQEDPIALFTRLNIGKIPLTNAELVKALFLADSNETLPENKKQEIAFQWDYIEKELHDEIFWSFLTKQGNYQTRIDLVLNLVANSENKNKYDTFFYFNDDENKNKLSERWDKIIQIFYLLKEWYEDYELYHKIGYLIASDTKSLLDLYKISNDNRTKTVFKTKLTEEIEKSIEKITDIDDFSYESNRQSTQNLLLLFNIETIRQTNNKSYRFPFHIYNKLIWSIEHIHAQNSEDLPENKWKDWLNDHKGYFENNDTQKEVLEKINTALKKLEEKKLSSNEFMSLQNEILNSFSEKNESNIHSVDNLALLSRNNNSALNNSIFPIKRNKIIQMDMGKGENKSKKDIFIPPCTKNVFLKYYTPSDKEQVNYWGQEDKAAYKKAIVETLKEYGIKENKEENNE